MRQLQLLRVLVLCTLSMCHCASVPLSSQCVDESFCTSSLQEYYSQLVDLPSRINERSMATWRYQENVNLNRVPQIIHEAVCQSSHSCRSPLDSISSLESVPITLRMPVLKKNPECFPRTTYSLEFESINIACICATSRLQS